MNRKLIASLYKKEMLDILRDKKTVIVMILIPLFLYPGMMILSLFVMNMVMKDSQDKTYEIVVEEEQVAFFDELLNNESDDEKYNFHVFYSKDILESQKPFERKDLHAVIYRKNENGKDTFEIKYKASDMSSSTAYSACKQILVNYNDQIRDQILKEKFGAVDDILHPVLVVSKDMSTKEQTAGNLAGMIIPFMLITSILMGAIYPAIDATAGERERGTLETMMTLPVKNSEMMIGKFLSVSTVAVFSALLNILSMFFVFLYMYSSMNLSTLGFTDFKLSAFIPSVILLILAMPVFALFCSAVCLSVCLFSKSFKEANNYSTPILLVFMFASMAGMIPNLKLELKTAFIPIVNITLLIKAAFAMEYQWNVIFVVFFSTIIYAFVAILVMSKLFSSEDVLFGEGFGSIKLIERRSNMDNNQMPGYGDLVLMFAVMLLVMIYSSSALVLKLGLWGTAVCQACILLVPIIYAWYMKADFKKLFSLHKPEVLPMVLAVPAWIGAWLIEQAILSWLSPVFGNLGETAELLNETILKGGFPLALFVVGFCPAIAEEIAFRGFLFGTLKDKWKPWLAIIVSAAIFGLYHMNLLQFIGGLLVGSVMAYFVYKSNSIYTSSLMHLLNNSFSVVLTFYPELLNKVPILSHETLKLTDNIILFIVGIVILAGSIAILEKSTCKK